MRAFSRHKSTNGNALCKLLLIVQEQHRKALAARCEHLYKAVSDHAKAP